MSLDDLLPLLFGVFFLVSLARRRSRNSGAPRRGTQVPTFGRGEQKAQRETPPEATVTSEVDERSAPSASGPSSPDTPLDDMERRLLEAQRRVAEALRGERTPSATTSAPQSSAEPPPTPSSGPVRTPFPQGSQSVPQSSPQRPATVSSSPTPTGFLGREGGSVASQPYPAGSGFLGREGPPMRKSPKVKSNARTATKEHDSDHALLRFGDQDLVRAFIWRAVLDEPVGVKRLRRLQSQRR